MDKRSLLEVSLELSSSVCSHPRWDLVNSARLQTRPGPFSGEFGSHAWRIRPTPLENSACRLVNSDYLRFIIKLYFIIKLLINI